MRNYRVYQNQHIVNRLAKEENIEINDAEMRFAVLKTFLDFAAKSVKPCFPSKEIDDAWHTFILFTKDYQQFCSNFLQSFVHHVPFVSDEHKVSHFTPGYFCYIENKQFKRTFVKTLAGLERQFKANCGSGGDCTSCSKCGND